MKPDIVPIEDTNSDWLSVAVENLKADQVIAFPTDSIYGLLIKYTSENAQKLHMIRNRPLDKPFIVLVSSSFNRKTLINENKLHACADAYIEEYWPGKISMVLPKNESLKYPLGDTIAVRTPKKEDNPFLVRLLDAIGFPVLAPSANISGENALDNAEDIKKVFENKIEAVFSLPDYKSSEASAIWDLTRFPFRQLR